LLDIGESYSGKNMVQVSRTVWGKLRGIVMTRAFSAKLIALVLLALVCQDFLRSTLLASPMARLDEAKGHAPHAADHRSQDMCRMPPTTEPFSRNSLDEPFVWILADEKER
jgi:hypothetical protein